MTPFAWCDLARSRQLGIVHRRRAQRPFLHDRHSQCRLTFQVGASRGVPADTHLPQDGHDFFAFQVQRPARSTLGSPMPTVKLRVSAILDAFEQAQIELVGKAVILTDGKAGTVENVWLDELHGLRISIRGHDGKWPISTIKFAQTG
jgi:hypothetical protein